MEITKDLLQTIYQRAVQVCIATYGVEPDRIQISDEYGIQCVVVPHYSGGDEDWYDLTYDELTANLDDLIAERLRKREEERLAALEKRRVEEIANAERKKKERFNLYQELKKEFE